MTSAFANSGDDAQQDYATPGKRPSDAPTHGIRAVIYRRSSSPGPAEDEDSVTAQREACLRKARELGFSLIDEYVDPLDSNSSDGRNANCSDPCSRDSGAVERQQPGREFAPAVGARSSRQAPLASCTVLRPGRSLKEV